MTPPLQQATLLHNQGRLAEAEAQYRVVLADNPNQPDALALLGILLASQKNYTDAIPLLERAIIQDPHAPLFHFYLGTVFSASGNALNAISSLQTATKLKPDYGEAWLALSNCALVEKKYDLGCHAASAAEKLMPGNLAATLAHGLALDFLDREEEAVGCFERAVRMQPDYVPAWDSLGTTYQNLNRLEEAQAALTKSLQLCGTPITKKISEEDYTIQHWNLALLELLRGDLSNGFDHYRARFAKKGWYQRKKIPAPVWRGEEVKGKKILIVGEQGIGDVLMFCRYGKLLRENGATVTLLAHPTLVPLLARGDVADEVRSADPQTAFDFQTSVFDLPFWFKTTIESIPAPIPYLSLPTADEATKLSDAGKMKIGVVWAGNRNFGNDRRRSIPLKSFAEIFQRDAGQFYSLAKELSTADAAVLAEHNVINLAPKLTDFLATARVVNQLDLIISCDTSVAHLAGGMGKKTWLLLPFAPDWRWLTEREDSPWYPSMCLFRQSRKGDWNDVIDRVRNALDGLR